MNSLEKFQMMESEEEESRMRAIFQNGNEGSHYGELIDSFKEKPMNKIMISLDSEKNVSYELDIDNGMDMLVAIIDAMSHSKELRSFINSASEGFADLRKAQEAGLKDDFDKQQIDMFNNVIERK